MYKLRSGNAKIRNRLPHWIKQFIAPRLESWALSKNSNWNVWESLPPAFRDHSETGVYWSTAAPSCLAKSLVGFSLCKSWIWIFHRLLEGTRSENSSNSPGSTRLYKALKSKGCTREQVRGALGLYSARTMSRFQSFFLWGGQLIFTLRGRLCTWTWSLKSRGSSYMQSTRIMHAHSHKDEHTHVNSHVHTISFSRKGNVNTDRESVYIFTLTGICIIQTCTDTLLKHSQKSLESYPTHTCIHK